MKKIFYYCMIIAGVSFCAAPIKAQQKTSSASHTQAYLWDLYKSAVINSAYTDSTKIWNGLTSVTDANHNLIDTMINGEQYILVVTWKAVNYYVTTNTPQAQIYNTQGYDMWVTIAPELKQKVKTTKPAGLDLRLEQILGLPPLADYYHYIFEFWVRPQDLYRPCPDNEITDNACQIAFPSTATPAFIAWIDSQRISRFFGGNPQNRYPWTELGYTYDWNPENHSHHGCSEFVIKKFAAVYQRHFYTTTEYIYGNAAIQKSKVSGNK